MKKKNKVIENENIGPDLSFFWKQLGVINNRCKKVLTTSIFAFFSIAGELVQLISVNASF